MQTRISRIFSVLFVSLLALAFSQSKEEKPASYSHLNVAQIAGKRLFELKKCADCHTLSDEAEGKLTPVTDKRSDEWFAEHVEEESPIVLREEKNKRRQRRILRSEIEALDQFLYETEAKQHDQIASMPENIFDGAYLMYQQNCLNCHKIAGFGKDIAPELTEVGTKHDKKWFIANLKNPQQFAPESLMPKFDFLDEEELAKIADYLLTLK